MIRFWLTAVWVTLQLPAGLVATEVDRVGYAFEQSTDSLVYTETHIRPNETEWRVSYADPNGEEIASKELRFLGEEFSPDFMLQDRRTGYIEGAEVTQKQLRLFTREDSTAELESKFLEVPNDRPLVIDAGFDRYVIAHWDRLMAGEKMHFQFAVPFRLNTYSLRLRLDKRTTYDGVSAAILKLEIDNFIIRLFVDAVRLTYDTDSRRLLAYEGATNINNAEGRSYKARVLFPARTGEARGKTNTAAPGGLHALLQQGSTDYPTE